MLDAVTALALAVPIVAGKCTRVCYVKACESAVTGRSAFAMHPRLTVIDMQTRPSSHGTRAALEIFPATNRVK